jgi:hypothetical protein
MYNGWGSIYWDSSVGDTAAWGLYLQSPPNVGVADQPLVDEFTTNYIVGGEALCLAPNFDNYTSEMGAISGITSPSNGSAEFNGTSDYIQLNDPFSLTNHTIAAWVYANDTGVGKMIFDNRDADNDGIRFLSKSDEGIVYSINAADVNSSASYINEWVYVVGTYDGTTQKLYIDGSLNASQAASQTISTSTDATIGKEAFNNAAFFNGNLANVAIWNRALTSDEINSVMWKQYEEISTSERNGLQAWYSLDSVDSFDWYTYAQNQGAVIEGRTCVDNALNALAQL